MTNQHSPTGERERIARAAWIFMCSSQAEFFEDPNGWWTFALKAASEMPNGPHADLVERCRVFADAILSRPSRMAASSEGEALATKWEAECDRTPYEPGKECTGRRVALTQCARELRAMLASRPDAGREVELPLATDDFQADLDMLGGFVLELEDCRSIKVGNPKRLAAVLRRVLSAAYPDTGATS